MSLDLGELVGRARIDLTGARSDLRDLDVIMQRAPQQWEQSMRRGGNQAGQAAGDGITRGVRTGTRDSDRAVTQAGAGWRATAGRAGGQAGEEAGQSLSERMTERLTGLKDKIGSILSGDINGLDSVMGAAGLAIGGVLMTAIGDAMAQQSLVAELEGQFGLTKEQSANAGKAAGALFAGGYGEGLDEIKDALAGVIRNVEGMRNASAEALTTVTGQAMTTAKVLGEDVGASARAAGQMIRTGLAKDATQAFDLLTAGAQNGANAAEDLSDTFIEYGTQFRKVGIDGQTAMGLLSQGMKGGARDADLVADAIKEFSIRAIDGSDATAEAFDKLGLSGEDMVSKIAAGGPTAKAGLDQVLDSLRKIPDPAERSQIAVGLFGTQAEDLGDALYKLDLDTAATDMGNVAGAADKANASFNRTPQAKLSSFWRSIRGEGVEALGALVTAASDAADRLEGVTSAAGSTASGLKSGWSSVPQPIRDAALAIGAVMLANRLLGDRMGAVNGQLRTSVGVMREVSTANRGMLTTAQGSTMQMGRFGSSIQALGAHAPAVQRLQTAFVNAAEGANRFPRAAGAAAASMSLMRSAGSGLLGAIGGPFGAALLAGGIALMAWQKHQQDAAQAAAESKARVQELTDTLDKNTFATTAATRAAITKTLSDKGVYEGARKYGLNLSVLTDAIMGNKDALALVNGELDASNLAYQQHAAEAANDGTQVQANDKANRALKDTINGLAGETKGSIQAAKDQAAAMKTGAQAAQEAKTQGTAYGNAMAELKGKTAAAKAAHDRLRESIMNVKSAFVDGIDAEIEWQQAIDDATDAAKANGKTLDLNTQKGRDNMRQLQGVARAAVGQIQQWETAGLSAKQIQDKMPELRKQLQTTAGQFGLTGKAAKDYVDGALANIPKDVATTIKVDAATAKAAVKALGYDYDTLPKDVQSKITVSTDGTTNAKEVLGQVGLAARNIPGQTTTVTSVPTAIASTALLSQLRNVAFQVDGKTVTVTSFAPQAGAVTQALKNISGAAVSADGKSVTVPTGAPNAPLTRLLLDNITGAAYNADTKSVSVPTAAPGAINAKSQIDNAGAAAFRVNGTKATITVETIRREIFEKSFRGYTFSATASANGNILDSMGRVTRFANGGIENHQAQIAPAGAWRVWAEPETGGEAYIPLAASKRDRSMRILAKTAELMGARVVPYADGGTYAVTGGSMPGTVRLADEDRRLLRAAATAMQRAPALMATAARRGIEGRDAITANNARLYAKGM